MRKERIKKAHKPLNLILLMALSGIFPLIAYISYAVYYKHDSVPLAPVVICCVVLPVLICLIFDNRIKQKIPKLYKALQISYICIGLIYVLSFTVFSVWVCSGVTENVKADVYIVFGCRTHGYTPSKGLQRRLDKALTLLKENPDSIAVLSGGQGDDETVSEAEAMRKFLTDSGISPDRLYLEDKSTATEENLIFSYEIIKALGLENKKIAGVSSDFHMKRIAKQAALADITVTPCGAKSPFGFLTLSYLVREYMVYIRLGI